MIDQITEVYERRREDLVRIYKSRAGANDVEDLIQEAFYRAIVYKDSYNSDLVELEFWLVGIVNNCLKDLLNEKAERSAFHKDVSVLLETEEDTYTDDDRKIPKEEIVKLIQDKRTGNAKQICYFHFVLDYSLSEIARIMPCSYSNINNVTDRFKQVLRRHYGSI